MQLEIITTNQKVFTFNKHIQSDMFFVVKNIVTTKCFFEYYALVTKEEKICVAEIIFTIVFEDQYFLTMS